SGFDAEDVNADVNVGDSADYEYIVYEEDESEGGEFDGDESDFGDCDDFSKSENTVVDDLDENSDTDNETTHSDENAEELFIIDDADDIVKIDMFNLNNEDVSKLQFGSLEVAYKFYCWFAKMNGFAVRKGQVIKNKAGDVVQQTFMCNLEGFRKDSGLTIEMRMHGPKHETSTVAY
ncbi:protein FAR1-RELATED SEQUENCE 5, partial [Trifolium medium]|nr:protein FAR1-RELATED SEQUENCE 5 [Trifolium medium]